MSKQALTDRMRATGQHAAERPVVVEPSTSTVKLTLRLDLRRHERLIRQAVDFAPEVGRPRVTLTDVLVALLDECAADEALRDRLVERIKAAGA